MMIMMMICAVDGGAVSVSVSVSGRDGCFVLTFSLPGAHERVSARVCEVKQGMIPSALLYCGHTTQHSTAQHSTAQLVSRGEEQIKPIAVVVASK
jgi:hypothetical protein